MHCTYLQLTLIEVSPHQSSFLLVQVFQTRNIYLDLVDGVVILWLVCQFLVSLTWTLFFLPWPISSWVSYFFLWSDLFFQKSGLQVCGTCYGGDFHYCLTKKKSIISFSPPFSLLSFSFLVLALSVKYCSHVSTKLKSLRGNWYPIGDAIVVMWKVSTG